MRDDLNGDKKHRIIDACVAPLIGSYAGIYYAAMTGRRHPCVKGAVSRQAS